MPRAGGGLRRRCSRNADSLLSFLHSPITSTGTHPLLPSLPPSLPPSLLQCLGRLCCPLTRAIDSLPCTALARSLTYLRGVAGRLGGMSVAHFGGTGHFVGLWAGSAVQVAAGREVGRSHGEETSRSAKPKTKPLGRAKRTCEGEEEGGEGGHQVLSLPK